MSAQFVQLIRIKELATEWRITPDTVLRWIRRGIRIDGQVMRMEGVRIGTRWHVTRTAADLWWKKLNGHIAIVEPAREARKQAHQRALAELRERWGLTPDPERARARNDHTGPHTGRAPA